MAVLMLQACHRDFKVPAVLSAYALQANHDAATELQNLYNIQKTHPGNLFDNEANIRKLARQIQQNQNPLQLPDLLEKLARQYLYAGKPDTAITTYRQCYALARQLDSVRFAYLLANEHLQLAKCWFRLGELQNCQQNHNNQSCIVPFTPLALHRLPDGSTNAIRSLQQHLKNHPENAEALWLLNIACITIGLTPDSLQPGSGALMSRYDSPPLYGAWRNITSTAGIHYMGTTGGCIIEDFNNDGLPDLFITAWHLNENVALYNNNGNGTFTNITGKAGLQGITGGSQCITTDFDNDGLLDITILRGGWGAVAGHQPKTILRNMGKHRFADVTKKLGLHTYRPCHTACWADFDNDGFLDLFTGNESNYYMGDYSSNPCELWMNKGGKMLLDEATKTGLNIQALVKGVAATDINNDGYEDLFVGSYTIINADFSIYDSYKNGTPPRQPARLYLNNGNNTYTDATQRFGLHQFNCNTMGLNTGDIDNDGYTDLYLGTGGPDASMITPNILLRNIDGKQLADISRQSRVAHLQKGHGIAISDLDNDGDNDMMVNLGGAYDGDKFHACLFENPASGTNWITLRLQGTQCNRPAIGAHITIHITQKDQSTKTIHQTINSGASYGCSSFTKTIGLGTNLQKIEKITIRWPGGSTTTYSTLEHNKAYHITQNQATPTLITRPNYTFGAETATHACCQPSTHPSIISGR